MEGIGSIEPIHPIRMAEIEKELFNEKEQLQVVPSSFYKELTKNERDFLCLARGLYLLPTNELVEALEVEMGADKSKAIEIAAGNGALGRALGITMTDSYMQKLNTGAVLMYQQMGQPPVKYGDDVKVFEALQAVKRFKPHTVVVAWGTHKYNRSAHHKGGNMLGIQFDKIFALDYVKRIILVGNDEVHRYNPLMELPHRTITGDFMYSRSMRGTDKIFIWEKE